MCLDYSEEYGLLLNKYASLWEVGHWGINAVKMSLFPKQETSITSSRQLWVLPN